MYKRRTQEERELDKKRIENFLSKNPSATVAVISEKLLMTKSQVITTLKEIENKTDISKSSSKKGYIIDTSICNYPNIETVLLKLSKINPIILTSMVIKELKKLSLKDSSDSHTAKSILSLCATDKIEHLCIEIDESLDIPDQNLLQFARLQNFILLTSDHEMSLLAECYGIQVFNTFSYKFKEFIDKNTKNGEKQNTVTPTEKSTVGTIIDDENGKQELKNHKLVRMPYAKKTKNGLEISRLNTKTQFYVKGRTAKDQILPITLKEGDTIFFLSKQDNSSYLLQEYKIANTNQPKNSYIIQQSFIKGKLIILKEFLEKNNLT